MRRLIAWWAWRLSCDIQPQGGFGTIECALYGLKIGRRKLSRSYVPQKRALPKYKRRSATFNMKDGPMSPIEKKQHHRTMIYRRRRPKPQTLPNNPQTSNAYSDALTSLELRLGFGTSSMAESLEVDVRFPG